MNKKQIHDEYWSQRSAEIMRYVDQMDIDVFHELTKIYSEQSVELQKEFYHFVLKYSDDRNLTYEEALERLRKEDLSDYEENARRYFEQAKENKDSFLLKRLNEQYVSSRVTRMDALNLEMAYRIAILEGLVQTTFKKYLLNIARYAYRKALGGNSGGLNEPALKILIETPFRSGNYVDQIGVNTDQLINGLKEVLKTGFVRGDSIQTMTRSLVSKCNVARSRAQTLIRTDGTAIVNRSAIQRYKDTGLLYYRDSVRLDARTTDICREIARENKRKLISEMVVGVNVAPYHYNCRTGVIPDDEELDTSKKMKELLEDESNKVYNRNVKESRQSSGSISKARGDIEKQKEDFAIRYYDQLRNSDRQDVIDKMVHSSNLSSEIVSSALTHVLDKEYMLWDFEAIELRRRNFYPDYDMAQSFQRLYLGNPEEYDIVMLQHESLESHYMNTLSMDYDDAHKLANTQFNYEEADKHGKT